ncbi:MAG TPA: class E sortase [Acidimicrobiales bacterium]|jgi:sortase A
MRLARVLGAIGRTCITAGVLILLFVAYQLWGTGLHEARAQSALEDEFADDLASAGAASTDGTDGVPGDNANARPATTVPPSPPSPDEGGAVAHIVIPAIGVDKIVVEGVTVDDLKRGPGHYPDSPVPGQPGNAAIAGHRTTYGAPFNRIDELSEGDEILITTLQGSFRYKVSEQQIVSPDQVEVLNDFGDNRLTLTACNPKYSARERIVIVAKLAEEPTPAPPTTAPAPSSEPDQPVSLDGGLSGERASAWPAVLLGLACALIWLAAWIATKFTKKIVAYGVGGPIFFVVLFFFYESFYRLLPANF